MPTSTPTYTSTHSPTEGNQPIARQNSKLCTKFTYSCQRNRVFFGQREQSEVSLAVPPPNSVRQFLRARHQNLLFRLPLWYKCVVKLLVFVSRQRPYLQSDLSTNVCSYAPHRQSNGSSFGRSDSVSNGISESSANSDTNRISDGISNAVSD